MTWRRPHESLTGLLVIGFAGLLAGLLLTAVLGVLWLGQMRRDLERELGSLEQSSEMGNVSDVVAGEAGHGSDDSPNGGEPGCRAIVAAMSSERCRQ